MKTKIELGYRVLTIENKPKDDRFELTVGSLINNKKNKVIFSGLNFLCKILQSPLTKPLKIKKISLNNKKLHQTATFSYLLRFGDFFIL